MNIPKKILYIHHGSGKGGAAVSLITLIKKLDRTRYNPIVACDFINVEVKQYFEQSNVRVIDINLHLFVHTSSTWIWYTPKGLAKLFRFLFYGYWKTRKALLEIVSKTTPDLVHLNGLTLLPYSKFIKSLDVPVVQHVREPVNKGVFGVRKKILRYIAKTYVSHIIFISYDNKSPFMDDVGQNTVLYNPVDLCSPIEERNKIRNCFGILQDEFTIFFPGGSVFLQKGIMPFLKSVSYIKNKVSNLKVIIPGIDFEPHQRDKIRYGIDNFIEQNDLSHIILRLPFSTNVSNYYEACDLVVVPFVYPHFSRGAIEAGFMKKPVIGSKIDVIKEVIDENQNGLLVNPGDARDLAEKIMLIIGDPELARKLAEFGFRRSRKEYDAKKYASSVMSIYDELFSGTN